MANNNQKFQGNARVFILMDDYKASLSDDYMVSSEKHVYKTLYQLTSFTNVSTTISVEGNGTANISFNDKDFRFFKKYSFKDLSSKDWGAFRYNKTYTADFIDGGEIEFLKSTFKRFGVNNDIYKALEQISNKNEILGNIITPQNILWVHYMGRDGYWYSGFTGIISSVELNHEPYQTPTFKIIGKTLDRIFEYSYIKTGQGNIGGIEGESPTEFETVTPQDNSKKVAYTNNFGYLNTSQAIVEALLTCNRFFDTKVKRIVGRDGTNNITEDFDYRYFKVDNIFDFGEKIGDNMVEDLRGDKRPEYVGEKGLELDSDDWRIKRWRYDEALDVAKDFYPGTDVFVNKDREEQSWIPVKISKDYVDVDKNLTKPFQNLVRTNLQLFVTEKMTVKDVINTIKKSAYCLAYFDADGSFKVERPYFDTRLNYEASMTLNEYGVGVGEPYIGVDFKNTGNPKDYNDKYIISKKDISYVSSSYVENETGLVTRTQTSAKFDFLDTGSIEPLLLTGKSESSWKTIGKFGAREVTLDSIVHPNFKHLSTGAREILDSYSFCMKNLLSSNAKVITLVLDQRPDIQLNRNMYFVDYGISFVTKVINSVFNPKEGRLTTTIQGYYVRPIGFPLINPYFWKVKEIEVSPGLAIEPWQPTKFIITKKLVDEYENRKEIGKQVTGNDIHDYGESYSSIATEIVDVSNKYYKRRRDVEVHINALIMRYDNSKGKMTKENLEFFTKNEDIIYFIWKDGDTECWAKFPCIGGNPVNYIGKNLLKGRNPIYAKLEQGSFTMEAKTDGVESNKVPQYMKGGAGGSQEGNVIYTSNDFEYMFVDEEGTYGNTGRNLVSTDMECRMDNYFYTKDNDENFYKKTVDVLILKGSGTVKKGDETKKMEWDDFINMFTEEQRKYIDVYVQDWYHEKDKVNIENKNSGSNTLNLSEGSVEKAICIAILYAENKLTLPIGGLALPYRKENVNTEYEYNIKLYTPNDELKNFDKIDLDYIYKNHKDLFFHNSNDDGYGLLRMYPKFYDDSSNGFWKSISKEIVEKKKADIQIDFIRGKYIPELKEIYNKYAIAFNNIKNILYVLQENTVLRLVSIASEIDMKKIPESGVTQKGYNFPSAIHTETDMGIYAMIHLAILNRGKELYEHYGYNYSYLSELNLGTHEIFKDINYYFHDLNLLNSIDYNNIVDTLNSTDVSKDWLVNAVGYGRYLRVKSGEKYINSGTSVPFYEANFCSTEGVRISPGFLSKLPICTNNYSYLENTIEPINNHIYQTSLFQISTLFRRSVDTDSWKNIL